MRPEFSAGGKAELPVHYLLSHRAGLPAIRKTLADDAIYDWEAMTAALAEQEPWWEPGTQHGYHALTFGFLVGEGVRRVDGRSLGTFFRDEIATPLGVGADVHIGLDPSFFPRVAEMGPMAEMDSETGLDIQGIVQNEPDSVSAYAFANPPNTLAEGVVNSPEWRSAEIPGANGHATARALARIYGALAIGGTLDGYRVLAPESIARCHLEQSRGLDEVLRIAAPIAV